MKEVKFTEVTHQWEGTAIVREEGQLKEIPLGVIGSDKKLKETGAKELFTNAPKNTIAIEVKKLTDVVIEYSADLEKFKEIAVTKEVKEEQPSQETEVQA